MNDLLCDQESLFAPKSILVPAYFCDGVPLRDKAAPVFPEIREVVQDYAMFVGTGYKLRREVDVGINISPYSISMIPIGFSDVLWRSIRSTSSEISSCFNP